MQMTVRVKMPVGLDMSYSGLGRVESEYGINYLILSVPSGDVYKFNVDRIVWAKAVEAQLAIDGRRMYS